MEGVSPEYLLRPKERTYEGVCELLEQTKEELKQAEAKKNANVTNFFLFLLFLFFYS